MMLCVLMVWGVQKDHFLDCYFCMTKISEFSKKTKCKIKYPDFVSAIKLVPHSAEYAVPEPPSVAITFDFETESSVGVETSNASEFKNIVNKQVSSSSHILTRGDLQGLVRDLNLSIEKSEILTFRLKQRKLLEKGVNITFFRKQHFELAPFFPMNEDICHCNDLCGLMRSLDHA